MDLVTYFLLLYVVPAIIIFCLSFVFGKIFSENTAMTLVVILLFPYGGWTFKMGALTSSLWSWVSFVIALFVLFIVGCLGIGRGQPDDRVSQSGGVGGD